MWSDARCKEAKQRCCMLAVRSETNLLPLVPTASPGVQVKSTKAERTTKQHVNVTSSRKPKSTLSAGAHTHTHTRWHDANLCWASSRSRQGGGAHPCCLLARMISCTLLHPVAAAGSGCSRVCRMHPANTGTRRFMHIGAVDTCVLVLLALQLLGCCCWWREWRMLC